MTPTPAALKSAVDELHAQYADLRDGRIADYIPELAKASRDWFGIAICTLDAQIMEAGDFAKPFTIQSVSKPFVYGMGLDVLGRDAILARVGVEPTGDAFNSLIKLDDSARPHNPMVNAGAIAVTSLLPGPGPTERLHALLEGFRRFLGRPGYIDVPTFVSERTTGHRNRAIAHLMLHNQMLDNPVDEVLDLYFQQCSLIVSARDLAVMAATLANRGVNPTTGERAIAEEYVRDVLSVMYTCGLYDGTGEWAYEVGLPAKSGISGGMMVVVPGKMGIGVFSPPVDPRGQSVRAKLVCRDLSARFNLHIFG